MVQVAEREICNHTKIFVTPKGNNQQKRYYNYYLQEINVKEEIIFVTGKYFLEQPFKCYSHFEHDLLKQSRKVFTRSGKFYMTSINLISI